MSRSASLPADVDVGTGQPGQTFLTTVDPESISRRARPHLHRGISERPRRQTVIVDTTTAEIAGLSVGDDVTFIFPTGTAKGQVAGICMNRRDSSAATRSPTDALEAAGVNVGDVFVYVKADQDARPVSDSCVHRRDSQGLPDSQSSVPGRSSRRSSRRTSRRCWASSWRCWGLRSSSRSSES